MANKVEIIEHDNGKIEHYRNGKLHRDDGPAIIYPSGTEKWYNDGELHCDTGPAIEKSNGDHEYYQYGKKHREDGPAVITSNQSEWWLNGERHRDDGPAIEGDNFLIWYKHGKKHRDDGPAMIYPVDKVEYWYIEDVLITDKADIKKLKQSTVQENKEIIPDDVRDITFKELEQLVGFKFRLIG